jgi:hypothetical protein
MSLNSFIALMLAAAMTCLLPGCSKIAERLEQDPDEIGKFCRIDTFNYTGMSVPYYQQVTISYNRFGNPVTMAPSAYSPVFGEDFDDIFFRYDKFDRLVDCIFGGVDPNPYPDGPFSIGSIDLWHRFTYPMPGIVVDSFFNYDGPGIPPIENPPPGYVSVTVSRYELDKEGRTIRTEVKREPGTASSTTSYNTRYDNRGNMVRPGIVYDDKVNVYRTNKVWQLLFQDYSMNNPIFPATTFYPPTTGITAFNKWGLPLGYAPNEGHPEPAIFFYILFQNLEISYSCDKAAGKLPPFSAP